jgi:lipid A 3-O-deacylase
VQPKQLCLAMIACLAAPFPAQASELFGGVYAHDADTPWTRNRAESGADIQFGWRGGRMGRTPLEPYAFLAVNTSGGTNYGAVGLSTKFGDRLFIRPGLGIAVHTGSAKNHVDLSNDDIEFGSRVLFEPEIGMGAMLNKRLSFEASLVHMSHAQLFGQQNPGIFNLGVRLTWQMR